jgi:hypothetical protein
MKQLDKLQQLKPLYDEITESLKTCNTDKYMFCVMLHYKELVITGWLRDRIETQYNCSFVIVNGRVYPSDVFGVSASDVNDMVNIITNWINGEIE